MSKNNLKAPATQVRESTSGQQPHQATAASTAPRPSGSLPQPFAPGSLCVNNQPLPRAPRKTPPQPDPSAIHEDLLRAEGQESAHASASGDKDSEWQEDLKYAEPPLPPSRPQPRVSCSTVVSRIKTEMAQERLALASTSNIGGERFSGAGKAGVASSGQCVPKS